MEKRGTQQLPRELTVGQVAARSGVSVPTLHFYEAKGLISSWRNSGNQRRYAREVMRRVALIKVAQRTGISLASIKQALNSLPKDRTPNADDWKILSAKWRAGLDDHRSIDAAAQSIGCTSGAFPWACAHCETAGSVGGTGAGRGC
jgi:MerR family redox-sensitive transcriptional activator SoxR